MSEVSETTGRAEEDRSDDRPRAIARRAVLRRGAKLVYIIPAVLAAMKATTALAAS